MSASTVAVVPAYLRTPEDAAWLARGAEALLRQPLDRVVVVDDASPVPPPAIPGRVELLRSVRNAGPAAARNRGIERALALGARVVLFTDHDCVCDPGWADALARAVAAPGVVAASGVTRSLGRTWLDRYQDFAGALNGRWALPGHDALIFGPSCNLAVRAEALLEVRFDERFPTAAGEDFDFCHRLRRLGTIAFAPDAVVRHDFGYRGTVRGLRRFLRQVRRYGAADPLLWEKHPDLRTLRSEACAAADVGAAAPPREPAAYRRAALSRVRPQRLVPFLFVMKHLARREYRRGQRAPDRWRAVPAAGPAGTLGAS